MANPYKEAEKNKKKPPVKPQDTVKPEEKVSVPSVEEETPVAAEKTAPVTPETPKEEVRTEEIDILADIQSEKPDTKSTYSLYLSDAVMAEAKKLAKAKGYKNVAPFIDVVLKKAFKL